MRPFLGLTFSWVLLCAGFAPAADLPADWAFKKPVAPTIPKHSSNPIDAFLLAKLEAAKLRFAPPAEKRTLIRRVTFDLTGLPPTPDEIAAFLNDDSPNAYEKLVDRLLASPRFGERAAMPWLDVVRYAESDGFKADDLRPTAWRYRDYVINSLNADKPFDRFLREQLAGDELYPNDPDARIATGFLRHAPYEYNAVNVELRRQDLLNDITDTTAAAFLGLTLGCAKCHDHKTDPVTQEEYYKLQAFFAGHWPVDVPLKPVDSAKLAAWEAKTEAVRKQMAELEKPFHDKAMIKERSRFPAEYSALLDIPDSQRTPLQKQLAWFVERQVYSRSKFTPTQLKPEEKAKYEALAKQLAELSKEKPADPPIARGATDVGPVPPPTHLLKRGNVTKPGAEVTPGFPFSLEEREPEITATAVSTGRRTALANWIASKDNPLTARVAVNRVWQQLFGRGIVATSADFGATGERPTHPELLDWLALDFTKHWSLKKVYRQLVLTAAYRQSAVADHGQKADPDNALLWRMPRKRLEGETLRDALLAAAGTLNPKAGGPGVYPELPEELKKSASSWKVNDDPAERTRRSIYVTVKRNLRYPFFNLFDSPDRTEVCARRFVTITAPQALTLMNDATVLGLAKSLSARVAKEPNPEASAKRAFEIALGRLPDTEELAALNLFLKGHKGTPAEALADLCHAIVNLNEFLYVD